MIYITGDTHCCPANIALLLKRSLIYSLSFEPDSWECPNIKPRTHGLN